MISFPRTVLNALLLAAALETVPAAAIPPAIPLEQEAYLKIQKQPVGNHTIEDFALPEQFVRRVADRVVRIRYQDRFRMVFDDRHAVTEETPKNGRGEQLAHAPLRRYWPLAAAGVAICGAAMLGVRRHRKPKA